MYLHVSSLIPVNKRLLRPYWVLPYTLKKVKMLVVQSCPTLCNTMDCSLKGSSVDGILQARIMECIAIPFFQEIVPTQG